VILAGFEVPVLIERGRQDSSVSTVTELWARPSGVRNPAGEIGLLTNTKPKSAQICSLDLDG
jgi:non-canonical (house-cleaning) NTP pyrophosphatase